MVIYKCHPWNKESNKIYFLKIKISHMPRLSEIHFKGYQSYILTDKFKYMVFPFCTFSFPSPPYHEAYSANVHFILCDYVS